MVLEKCQGKETAHVVLAWDSARTGWLVPCSWTRQVGGAKT